MMNAVLREVNNSIIDRKLSLFKKRAACAIDYMKIPYHSEFNSFSEGKMKRGINQFYEYAAMNVVKILWIDYLWIRRRLLRLNPWGVKVFRSCCYSC